jgi:VWFA-related protein
MFQTSRRLFFLFVFLHAGFFATNAQQNAPDPKKKTSDEEIVRVETAVVTVPVSILDKDGKFIPRLTRDKFRLSENGIEQEIAFFDGSEAPFTVALLLDMSNSTKESLSDIQKSAVAFLDQLNPQDKVIIIAFNKDIYQLTEATNNRDELKKQIYRTISGGTTSVYDSMDFIGEKFRRMRGRKAIILFSDGVDTSSRATFESNLRAAREIDALVYTIRYETYNPVTSFFSAQSENSATLVTYKGENLKTAYERATRYLKLLADNSGGRYFLADSPKNLVTVFEDIAAELRQQYSIGYYPKEDASKTKLRKIKVSINVPNASVKARRSYVYKNLSDRQDK